MVSCCPIRVAPKAGAEAPQSPERDSPTPSAVESDFLPVSPAWEGNVILCGNSLLSHLAGAAGDVVVAKSLRFLHLPALNISGLETQMPQSGTPEQDLYSTAPSFRSPAASTQSGTGKEDAGSGVAANSYRSLVKQHSNHGQVCSIDCLNLSENFFFGS
jgi:hypothetical protein